MVQILPKIKGFGEIMGEAIGGGLGGGFQQGMSNAQEFAQKMQLEELKQKRTNKILEKEKFASGLNTINEMRNILKKGNVGRGSAIMGFFPGETQKDRAELEQLGKSLIPLVAAGVPIRNQKEFEEYRKTITDPSAPISAMEGALSGLERIFESKMGGEEEGGKKGKVKFDASNPEHEAKARQLHKKYGDVEKVRKELKREFEGL